MTTFEHQWIKFYVDGGTLMAGRHTHVTRGVYWSVRCEDEATDPFYIRQQDTFYKTNNDAEWLALREGLMYAVWREREKYFALLGTPPSPMSLVDLRLIAASHEVARTEYPIVIYSDSRLVVNQYNGAWRTKLARHHRFRSECHALRDQLKFVVVQWVPREVSVDKLGH